ncbi:MAG: hypothetical protein U0787_04155 [Polyangia bacterium]
MVSAPDVCGNTLRTARGEGESRAEELAEQFGKSWWREATLLALAVGSQDYAQKFFTAVLKTDAVMNEGGLIDQCLKRHYTQRPSRLWLR